MIELEGHLHRWTAPRKDSFKGLGKINEIFRSRVERLVDSKNICFVSAWVHLSPFTHWMRQPSRKKSARCNAPLLVLSMLHQVTFYERDSCAVAEVTYVGSVSSVALPVSELLLVFRTLANTLAKIRAAREYDGSSI